MREDHLSQFEDNTYFPLSGNKSSEIVEAIDQIQGEGKPCLVLKKDGWHRTSPLTYYTEICGRVTVETQNTIYRSDYPDDKSLIEKLESYNDATNSVKSKKAAHKRTIHDDSDSLPVKTVQAICEVRPGEVALVKYDDTLHITSTVISRKCIGGVMRVRTKGIIYTTASYED